MSCQTKLEPATEPELSCTEPDFHSPVQLAQNAQQPEQVSSWAVPGQSNAPPALLGGPRVRLQPPPNAMIDLTADSDASPSPSSSSDYQILSVDAPPSGSAASHREDTHGSSHAAGPVRRTSNPFWLQEAANARPRHHQSSDQQDQISGRLSSPSADARSWQAQHHVAQTGDQHDIAAVDDAWHPEVTGNRQMLRPAQRRRWDVTPEEMSSIGRGTAQGRGWGQALQQGQRAPQLDVFPSSGAIEHTQRAQSAAQPVQEASALASRHRKRRRDGYTPTDGLDAADGSQLRPRHRAGSSSSRSRASSVRDSHRRSHRHRQGQSSSLRNRHDEAPVGNAASCDHSHGVASCWQPRPRNQSELQRLDSRTASGAAAPVSAQHPDSASDRWQLWQPGMQV